MLSTSTDFHMKVAYGQIAGKIWSSPEHDVNSPDTVRIIALHGWQDNCGTFDHLMPKLPDHYYVVAIDFPGHGHSSHLPAGSPYNDLIFVIELEKVIKYLKWKDSKFTILGHSMGAAIGMFYACLYPDAVKQIVSIDMIKPVTFPREKLAIKTREAIEQFLQIENKLINSGEEKVNGTNGNCNGTVNGNSNGFELAPSYDYDDAVRKLIEAHSIFGKISQESAKCLLKRGSKPCPIDGNKVRFTRDNRLKAMMFQRMDYDSLLNYFQDLKCRLLIVKAEKGIKLDPDSVIDIFVELYKKQCESFEMVKVPGGHHVHLCDSDQVKDVIVNFIAGC